MQKYTEIPPEKLHDFLRYDPETGKLFWQKNNARSPQWNGRYAGKEALTAEFVGGYRHGQIFGLRVRAHRVIWAMAYGRWPNGEIDHINGIPSDNRLRNLREVDRTGQNRNQKLALNNKSGRIGVFWHKASKKWTAQISVHGKARHLGLFDTLEEASAARAGAEIIAGYHPNHGQVR